MEKDQFTPQHETMTSSAPTRVPGELYVSRKLGRRLKHDSNNLLCASRTTKTMDDPKQTLAVGSSRSSHGAVPAREDCWTEEATRRLIEAWGERYLDLNRGNLRQKHWKEVADAVNAKHGNTNKTRRTDVQCKNRIDTLKKKYKIEKSRVSAGRSYVCPWSFFQRLDSLIGPVLSKKASTSPAIITPVVRHGRRYSGLHLASPVPVAPRSASVKRLPASVDHSSFRRNFLTFAAAEKAAEDSDDTYKSRSSSAGRSSGRGGLGDGGYKELAQALATFVEIYERVESSKQKQIIELEKQRMQFAKDLEIHRMEMLVDMQLQFERSKRQKRHSNGADSYS